MLLGRRAFVAQAAKRQLRSYRFSHKAPDFSKYIAAMLKITHPSLAIGKKTVSIINSFLGDVLEKMTEDAKKLSQNRGSRTVTDNDMRTATRLLLPAGMNRDGQSFAGRCVGDYQRTVQNRAKAQLRRKAKKS